MLKTKLTAIEARLGHLGKTRSFTDAVPLLERAVAERAGLGFIGRNSLLIRPAVGSMFFLGEILTDFEIEPTGTDEPVGSCGTCRRCVADCPTSAIVADKIIDARRCISYLTIEHRGVFSPEQRTMLGEWIFGCDICQEVCPFNHTPVKIGGRPKEGQFAREEGVGPLLAIRDILRIQSDDEFRARFKGTPLLRAKRAGLIRNACAVAGNVKFDEAVVELRALVDDTDSVVRQSASDALQLLSSV